MMGTNCIMWKR